MSSIENAKIQPAMDAAGHLVATNHCKRGAQLGLHVCLAAPPQPARTPLTLSLPLLALAASATSAMLFNLLCNCERFFCIQNESS